MKQITARLVEARQEGLVRRTVTFDGQDVWWEISGPNTALPPELSRHDMAATALVFYAMHQGRHLHIDGPVSASLLENLENLIACWALWRPDLYRSVPVTAATVVAEDQPESSSRGKAVAAFSGGVDASFTLYRHATQDAGLRSKTLVAGVLIHGMDIPLERNDAFGKATQTAADTLASVSVPLVILRTNWKAVACIHWEMEFGTAVSTCLRNWQGAVDTGLLGSDEDYSRLELPWGGNPITYAMLSGRDFAVVYDGGEYPRTEKVRYLTSWDAGVRNLRVCWQGPITGKNCGQCEKCIRTKMNFLAVGAPTPPSLPGSLTPWQVMGLRVGNDAQMALMNEIYDIAKSEKIDAAWLKALPYSLAKNRLMNTARRVKVLKSAWRFAKSIAKGQAA